MLRTAPVREPRPASSRVLRWSLALLATGALAFVLRHELRAGPPPPVRPADPDALDPAVRRLIEQHVQAVEERPTAAAHGLLGLAYEANGLWREAEQALALASVLASDDALWPLHHGNVLVNLGRFEDARAAYRRSLERDQRSAAAHQRLAETLLASGALEEALPHFLSAVELAPERAEGHCALGAALLRRGELVQAGKHLTRAVELAPASRAAHYQLGLFYRELGRLGEAESELALGTDAAPEYIPDALDERMRSLRVGYSALRRGAQGLLDGGRAEEGIALLEALRKQRPDDVYVLNDLAVAYLREGEDGRAHELLLAARALDEQEFATWINLAGWGLQTGQLDQALGAAERAVELAGPVASAHLVHGNVLEKLGRLEEALAALLRAEQLDARNPDVHHSQARVYARLLRYEDARASLLATTSLEPARWQAFLDLSQVHLRLGNLPEARKALGSAQILAPEHPLVVGLAQEIERRASRR